MTDAQSTRARRVRPLSLAVATLAAAFSAVSPVAAQQPEDMDPQDRMLAFSQCMRDNGVPEFPDPGPDGRLRFELDPGSASNVEAAQEACRDVSPFNIASGPPTPEQMERLVQLAQCVRDNGVADFPDPTAEGQFSLGGSGVDPESPTMQTAMQTCMQAGGPGAGGGVMIRITP